MVDFTADIARWNREMEALDAIVALIGDYFGEGE
jgi:hypothetical protein